MKIEVDILRCGKFLIENLYKKMITISSKKNTKFQASSYHIMKY